MASKQYKHNRTSTIYQHSDIQDFSKDSNDLSTNCETSPIHIRYKSCYVDFSEDNMAEGPNRIHLIPRSNYTKSIQNGLQKKLEIISEIPKAKLLWKAAKSNKVPQFIELWKGGIDVNYKKHGTTCLHMAAERGHRKICEAVLDFGQGAYVDILDDEGCTALHLAAKKAHFDTIKMLIRSGANWQKQDKLGNTPLHYLAWTNDYNAIEWFVSHWAELSISNHQGKLPYQLSKNPDITSLLTPESMMTNLSQMNLLDFSIIGVLGTGSFGDIYLAEFEGEKVALKTINKKLIFQRCLVKYAKAERNICTRVDHPFIVSFKSSFQNDKFLFLCFEYLPGGSLAQAIKKGKFSAEKTLVYFRQILLAVEYLHSCDIIHRDIKPSNVLIDSKGNCKLIDFGLSKEQFSAHSRTGSVLGTVAYMPPEIAHEMQYTRKVDTYGLGALLYEMLTGKPPYLGKTKKQMIINIKFGSLEIPSKISLPMKDLIWKMLWRDFDARPSISEIKNHPVLASTNWQDVLNRKIEPLLPITNSKPLGPCSTTFKADIKGKRKVEGWSFVK